MGRSDRHIIVERNIHRVPSKNASSDATNTTTTSIDKKSRSAGQTPTFAGGISLLSKTRGSAITFEESIEAV